MGVAHSSIPAMVPLIIKSQPPIEVCGLLAVSSCWRGEPGDEIQQNLMFMNYNYVVQELDSRLSV